MTQLLDQAIQVARALPECREPVALSAEEEASFDESLAEEERGEFVSDDKLRAFWAKAG